MRLGRTEYSRAELESHIRIERMELQRELLELQQELRRVNRRRDEIAVRLAELDSAENLLEGM